MSGHFERLTGGIRVGRVPYLSTSRVPKIRATVTTAMAERTGTETLEDPVWREGASSCTGDAGGQDGW